MNKGQIDALMKNKEEFEKIAKKGFEEVDTNKNGAIDFEEDVYTKLDKDKNGKVDFEEFKVFFKQFLEMQ